MVDYFQYSDKQLLALICEKSEFCNEVFNVIYTRYSDKLKTYCRFQTLNKEKAKELHQETWIRFYSAIKSEYKDLSLPAYLYKIARNLNIDYHRVHRNQMLVFDDTYDYEEIISSVNLQTFIENQDLLNLVILALDQMPENYKEVFVLKWFSGLNYLEIAQIVGENSENVRKRCSRAFNKIIDILNPVINEIK